LNEGGGMMTQVSDNSKHLAENYLRQIRRFSPNAGSCLEELHSYGSQLVTYAALITLAYYEDMLKTGSVPDCEPYLTAWQRQPNARMLLEHALNALATDWQIGNIRKV